MNRPHQTRKPKNNRRSSRRVKLARPPTVEITHGHVVDRAIAVAKYLEELHCTQSALARECQLSSGVISRLAGIGRALATLSPQQISKYKSSRVTWKVVQGIPVKGRPRDDILAALGRPLVTLRDDKRRRRTSRTSIKGAAFVSLDWVTDPSLTDNNPASFVRAYRSYLRELHEKVDRTLRQTIAATQIQDAGIPMAGQSLASILEAVKGKRATAPNKDALEARKMFDDLDAALRPVLGLR